MTDNGVGSLEETVVAYALYAVTGRLVGIKLPIEGALIQLPSYLPQQSIARNRRLPTLPDADHGKGSSVASEVP
jgi:hypothetical protein